MRKKSIPILAVMVFLTLSSVYCISAENNNTKDESYISTTDEIIFHSNGSSFSPVIVLQAAAEVLWTWDDNTTSNSTKPVKDYGSAKLRVNKLKVTPWSSVRRINIGYTAEDDGSLLIERVADQKVSLVENLHLVAPNLIEWCSSYNMLSDLDFSNFINIETIELFRSNLNNLSIANTPNLKRLCFEIGKINTLDLTTSNSIEDLRGANNRLPSIAFQENVPNIWHICVHHNPFISKTFFNDNMYKFPAIAELLIDYSFQEGPLIIEESSKTRNARIRGYNNKYTSIDFHNCLKEPFLKARIQMQNNEITTVNIDGCVQINDLDLNNNRLQTSEIDKILKQVNDYNTYYGSIDLRNNQPPSAIGINYINSLKLRGWEIQTDPPIPVQSIEVLSPGGNTISTDNGSLQFTATVLPDNATTKSVIWSVLNHTGEATINSTGLLSAVKNGTVKAVATANDGSGVKGEFQVTISNQVYPVENISVSASSATITTDNGTLQMQASVLPFDATNNSVTWSVINLTGEAIINSAGLLSAIKNGTVKAVATANDGSGVKGEFQVTISNQVFPVENILVTSNGSNTISIDNGTLQLGASILPTDATNQNVTWSVIEITGKAIINSSGLLTAMKNGIIKAVATANDGSGVKGEIEISITNQIYPVEIVEINSSEGNEIKVDNGTLQLKVLIYPTDATNQSVTWSVVEVTGKASISSSGLLTAIKNGTVKAIASANDGSGKKGEFQITISNQNYPVESITINSASGSSINKDDGTLQLSAIVLPVDAKNKNISWTVTELTGKATISTSGLVKAVKNGTVKAIASSTDGSGVKAEIEITITNQEYPVENITINTSSGSTIDKDDGTLQLTASVLPNDATNKAILWTVVDLTGKASISTNGLLKALKNGTVKAVASSTDGSGVKAELTVTITNQIHPVESITINSPLGNFINTNKGTRQLAVEILPADASNKTVNWSVADVTGKATISNTGLISAVENGTVKAIASSTDGSGIKGELIITISNQVVLINNLSIVDNLDKDTINGIGTKLVLKPDVLPQNATNKSVIWEVENISGQATITQNGELTTISKGKIKVKVKALDESGLAAQKEYVIAIPVSTNQLSYLDKVKVFPNPALGRIQIQFEKQPDNDVFLEIRNPLGQLLLQKQITKAKAEYDLAPITFGLYFVTITDKNKQITHKIINGLYAK